MVLPVGVNVVQGKLQHVGQNSGALRLFRRTEADGQPLFTGAGGTADAVNMHLRSRASSKFTTSARI